MCIWEAGARSQEWFGFRMPFLGLVPPPTDVFASWAQLVGDPSYWESWYKSFLRVFAGFLVAMLIGIPLGLLMAVNRKFYGNVDVAEDLTTAAIEFMTKRKEEPFFVYLCHWDVHSPIRARKSVVAKYREKLGSPNR